MQLEEKRAETVGSIQVLVAGVTWGLVGPLVSLMSDAGSTAEVTAFIRMAFAFLIMGAFTLVKFGPAPLKIDAKSLVLCAVLGIVSNGAYNVVYNLAIVNAGIAVSAVLLNSAPIFTTIFSVIIFREGVSLLKIAALVINILGCSLAATGGNFDAATISVLGIACGIAAAFTYGIAAVIARLAGSGTNSYAISTYSYLFAALFLGLAFQPWQALANTAPAVYGYGFLLALVPTVIAYLLYYMGVLKMKETSKVPIFASVEMVATALISVAFFGEILNGIAIAGIVLVIASIALMNLKIAPKR